MYGQQQEIMRDANTIGYREIDKLASRSMLLANPFGETGRVVSGFDGREIGRNQHKEVRR